MQTALDVVTDVEFKSSTRAQQMGSEKRATKPVGESARTGYINKLTEGFPDSGVAFPGRTSLASTKNSNPSLSLSATQRSTPLVCPMTPLLLIARVDIRATINLATTRSSAVVRGLSRERSGVAGPPGN
jgi:hypothetical protein